MPKLIKLHAWNGWLVCELYLQKDISLKRQSQKKKRQSLWRFLKKLGLKLPSDPTVPLLDMYPEKTITEKDTGTPVFISALFSIARTWKQPRCLPTDESIEKLLYIGKTEYYSAIKRNTFESVLMRWMNLEPIIQSEVSQKDKYMLTHLCGI